MKFKVKKHELRLLDEFNNQTIVTISPDEELHVAATAEGEWSFSIEKRRQEAEPLYCGYTAEFWQRAVKLGVLVEVRGGGAGEWEGPYLLTDFDDDPDSYDDAPFETVTGMWADARPYSRRGSIQPGQITLHDGGECPVESKTKLQYLCRGGTVFYRRAHFVVDWTKVVVFVTLDGLPEKLEG